MKKMRRVLALVLALCFAMALVGCGGGGLKKGKYTITSLKVNGVETMESLKQQGYSPDSIGYFEVKDSKNATLVIQNQTFQLTYDSKNLYLYGAPNPYKISGNTISFSMNTGIATIDVEFTK